MNAMMLAAGVAAVLGSTVGPLGAVGGTTTSWAQLVHLVAPAQYSGSGKLVVEEVTSSPSDAVPPPPLVTTRNSKVSFSVNQGKTELQAIAASRFGCSYPVPAAIPIASPFAITAPDPTIGRGPRSSVVLDTTPYSFTLDVVTHNRVRTEPVNIALSVVGDFPTAGRGTLRIDYRIDRVGSSCAANVTYHVTSS
jgi:hypothetical protein